MWLSRAWPGVLLALSAAGCGTPMRATRLSTPVSGRLLGTPARVEQVHFSRSVLDSEFDDDARILVPLALNAEGTEPSRLDLKRLRLTMEDAAGKRQVRAPLASGRGEPPSRLQDGEFAGEFTLSPGKKELAWVAFGEFPPRHHREIPERIELSLEAAAGPAPDQPTEPAHPLVLSDPGSQPVWESDGATFRFAAGPLLQAFDGGHAENMLFEHQFAFDPIWGTLSYGFGWRDDFASSELGCCNLALRVQVGHPFWQTSTTTLSAYLGGEAALAREDVEDGTGRRPLAGPGLGLSLALPPVTPRHGPFPISHRRTSLGALKVDVGFVWWFGGDRFPKGDPGAIVALTFGAGS